MIEFKHPLPAMNIDGRHNGTYNNWELVLPGVLTTTDTRLGLFLHLLHNVVEDDRRLVFIDGKVLTCCINWIRDHVHDMKAFKHWEYDLKSFISFIIDNQSPDGFFFELIKQMDDGHWRFVNEDCRRLYPEDNQSLVRLELEADIEYLVVEGAVQVWRATGDTAWLLSKLPALERAIEYVTSSPKRWSAEYGLAIRPLTIDTWDFTSDPASGHDRRIHDDEPMAAMHGDNSGLYQAMGQLAMIHSLAGNQEKAAAWRSRAETLRANMMRHLWNGRFFVHMFPVRGECLDDRERERLSLSNPYDINRGVTTPEESRAIIHEYQARRKTTKAFAEWFSIDPPYEKFGQYTPGNYVNGAISPFTAGELARAAFNNGEEAYGWDILSRFIEMSERDENIYFLYSPDNSEPQGRGPSAWAAAALLSAVDEGLAGIVDADCLYRKIDFSPRFAVTPYEELRYFTGYEVSRVFVELRYILTDAGMRYDLKSPAEEIRAHILLPAGKTAAKVYVNDAAVPFTPVKVGGSDYVDFVTAGKANVKMEILFA